MKETLNLHNDINEVGLLAEWLETIGEKYDVPMPDVFQLNLALEEAVVNVMSYAYPEQTGMPVTLTMDSDSGQLTFRLTDNGIPFDPTATEDPDITLAAEDREIGGLGTFLVRSIMDEVNYERHDNSNILTMIYTCKK